MLPAVARMRSKKDFEAARGGIRFGRRLVVGHLYVRANADDLPRVGFVVSRAVGGAVVRNRVRRRLRHLAAGYLHGLPRGSLLVLRANPQAATAKHADLAAELDVVIRALLRRQGGAA